MRARRDVARYRVGLAMTETEAPQLLGEIQAMRDFADSFGVALPALLLEAEKELRRVFPDLPGGPE